MTQHERNIRKQVCDQIYKLFTTEEMWSTLKSWWLTGNACREMRMVLDAIERGEKNFDITIKYSKKAADYALLDPAVLEELRKREEEKFND